MPNRIVSILSHVNVLPFISKVLGLRANAVQVPKAFDVPPGAARISVTLSRGQIGPILWQLFTPQCRWQQATQARISKRLALQVGVLVEVVAGIIWQLKRVVCILVRLLRSFSCRFLFQPLLLMQRRR